MTRSRSLLVAVIALGVLPGAALAQTALPAAAGAPARLALVQFANDGLLDGAQVFKSETAPAARAKIEQIRKEYHCAIVIDTVARVPDAGWSKAHSWRGRTRDEFFQDWAKDRSKQLGVEGIHILICQHPKHVAVVGWPDSSETILTPEERTGIERLLTRNLAFAPDETLLMALDQVRADLQTHREPQPPAVPVVPLGIFIGAAVGMWLVLVMVRWRLHKRDPLALTAQPQTLPLTSGLLAGMFGSPCAYWMTDRLFAQPATAGPPDVEAGDAPLAETPTPTDEALRDAPADLMEPMPEHAEIEHI
jgi:hypothetical protein